MNRWLLLLLTFFVLVLPGSVGLMQAPLPVPTLVPPTPLPPRSEPVIDALLTESAVARIQREGIVRVGVLYNEPPFSEMNIRGELTGYEPDIARSLAEAWGIDLQLVQVTRQNRLEMLREQQIDLLLASTLHRRELDAEMEFSHTYHISRQALMLRADDGASALVNLANRRIAYVAGTESEAAIQLWAARSGVPVQLVPYLTLDRAYSRLFAGEIDAIVGRQEHLLRVAADHPDAVKFLDEAVELEPFAIGFLRNDSGLRTLVNRSLQYLMQSGRLEELHRQYLPASEFPFDSIPVWANVGESAPTPDTIATAITYPAQYAVARILNERRVRVAGLTDPSVDALPAVRRIYDIQRALLEQMASRWQAELVLVSGDPIQLIESGQADIAVGVSLDWNLVDRVDFSQPYLLRGDRLMVRRNSGVNSFTDLRGRWVGIMSGDDGAEARALDWADSVGVRIRIFTTNERDAADAMLTQNNADVIYGDSLKLIAHLQQRPDDLRLTERWYSRSYLAFALPRNDVDMRHLVDYTLQELAKDSILNTVLAPTIPPGSEPPRFDIWPGASDFYGLSLD